MSDSTYLKDDMMYGYAIYIYILIYYIPVNSETKWVYNRHEHLSFLQVACYSGRWCHLYERGLSVILNLEIGEELVESHVERKNGK